LICAEKLSVVVFSAGAKCSFSSDNYRYYSSKR